MGYLDPPILGKMYALSLELLTLWLLNYRATLIYGHAMGHMNSFIILQNTHLFDLTQIVGKPLGNYCACAVSPEPFAASI